MTNGYFDPQGNYIPGSFADQLDMPGPGELDQAAIGKAKGALSKEAAAGHKKTLAINAQAKQLAGIKKQLQSKNLSKNARATLQRKSAGIVKSRSAAITSRNASIVTQRGLQNKVYEVSGQYEKLLSGPNRDAYASLRGLFNQFGLGSLAPKIYEYAKQGYGADVIGLLLQDTKEYKERFSGNEARLKKGLPVLSPAEYLSTEQAYRQILQDAGLPKGFYDSVTDFSSWIAGDVSPSEIKNRTDMAVQNATLANPQAKEALKQLYGVDDSYVTAYFLDRTKSIPLLQKQSTAAAFGAEALNRNLTDINKGFLEYLATSGLSQSQVREGYGQIADTLPYLQRIASRYGETFSQNEAEYDILGGNAYGTAGAPASSATEKRKRLASQERALFSGSGGATPGGLSTTSFQQT
jgi:hypothetical protein